MNKDYISNLSYVNSVSDTNPKPLTRDVLESLLDNPSKQELLNQYRASGDEEKKKLLSAITFNGSFCEQRRQQRLQGLSPEQQKNATKRAAEDFLPSGLYGIDIDTKGRPEELLEEVKSIIREQLGIVPEQIIAMAYRTPGMGLRVVVARAKGLTLAEEQRKWQTLLQGMDVDEACKDMGRLYFLTSREDLLYINHDLLFPEQMPDAEDYPLLNGKVKSASKREQSNSFELPSDSRFEEVKTENGKLREQVQDDKVGLKQTLSSSNVKRSTPSPHFPTHDENGIDLREMADALIAKHSKNGQQPIEGERHTVLKSVAPMMALKCENNPQWLAQVLPSYGLDGQEFQSIVEWACQLPQKAYTPRALKETIKRMVAHETGDMEQPPLPASLPTSIATLLEGTPEKCRPAVAQGILTAMMLYLHPDVRFLCTDNREKIPAGLNVCVAPHASGKSSLNYPIDIITRPIREADKASEEREQKWRDECNCKGGNKDKPLRPKGLCRQLLPPDITSAKFSQLLLDADGKPIYMKIDELDALLLLTGKTQPKHLGPYLRCAYDAAPWGQLRASAESVNGIAPLNLKIQASTTPAKALEFFKSMLSDGTFDRATFSTITGKGKPVYGTFGEEYEKSVRPYTDLIGAVRGIVRCTEAMEWAERMEQEQEALAEEMGIKAYKGLLPRAIQSAFFRAVMVYLMEDCKWTDEVEQFATWSLENDIWCKWYLFGSQLIEAQEREDAIIHSAPRMKSRTLEMLPPSFTRDDMHQAYAQQQKTKDAADVMLRQWKRRNLIRFDEQTNLFIKIA